MNRIGLKQLNSSARNSPFGQEKISANGVIEPLKVANLKKFQPAVPSPLTTSSPFNVFNSENKENKETQTVEKVEISTQTSISVPQEPSELTRDDLTAEPPTLHYLRCMADRLAEQLEHETETFHRLTNELCELDGKILKMDEDTQILLEVLEDIDEENKALEEGTSQL